MLFYPLTSLITGTEKSYDMCVCVCVTALHHPLAEDPLASDPPPRLPSDKVNKVCLANPARKYLFWKLPHPPGDAHVRSRVLRYIYGDNPDAAGLRMHTHRSVRDPGQTSAWTSTVILLNLAANFPSLGNKNFSSYFKSCQQFAFLFHSDFLTLSLQ